MVDTCNIEPFRYQAAPVPGPDDGASSNQINQQAIEGYLARLISTLCTDLQAIEARLVAIEARLDALEAP